jgi:ClpP class serine protease
MLPQILKQKLLPLELPLLFLGPPDYRAVKRVADLLGALPSYSNLGALAVSVEGQGGSHSAASELVHVLTKYRQKLGLPLYTFAGDYVTGSSLLLLLSGTRVYASKTSLLGLT